MVIEIPEIILDIYQSNPAFFQFIGILLLGYIGGLLVKNTILKISRISGFDNIMKSSKIQMVLNELGCKGTAMTLLAEIARLFIYILALSSAFEILGFNEISAIFIVILKYIPNIGIAVAILIIGAFIADLFCKLIQELVSGNDKTGELSGIAEISSSFTRLILYIVTAIIALRVLGVDPTAITVFMAVILLTASALLVLSMKDLAPNYMAGTYMKSSGLKEKDRVVVGNISGTIENINLFNTTIKSGRKIIVLPNSVFVRNGFEKQ